MLRVLLVVLLLLALAALFTFTSTRAKAEGPPPAAVQRGTIVRRAVAVGQVEPEHESHVNSQIGGVLRQLMVKLGQRVNAGDALAEVRPVLTDQDLLRAERAVAQAKEGEEAAREFTEGSHVLSHLTRFLQGKDNLDRMRRSAERGRRSAEEQLRLLREGNLEVEGHKIDFVVRAPVAGHVLALPAREGDPVTAASTYGLGTVLVTLGDLDRPVFRGTVDEIDVGRLREGMAARVTLGALPGVVLDGRVLELGLRARKQDNASVFDVRLAVTPRAGVQLRSGYSAVAEVEVGRAENVLVLPERLLVFRGDQVLVRVPGAGGTSEQRPVQIGLSDGLTVEIREGLKEGDLVVPGG
jgi:HlyD family secretion protein